jgi:Tol biopolymer transport system component
LPAALSQVFVNDSRTGESVMVSVDSSGVRGNGASARPSISADGRYVAFDSSATNLVPNDDNGKLDVFVHDRRTHTTIRASVSSPREESSYDSYWPSLSADGRSVAFVSASSLVPDGWFGVQDIYVHDCESGVTRRRSADSFGAGGDHHSEAPSISADGRFVAFSSQADNLVPQGTTFQGSWGVFVHDRSTGETSIVSVDSAGVQGNGQSDMPSISADGRFVMFSSTATNLVPGDTNGASDIFVHDRLTGATSRVSVDSSGAQGDSDSFTFTYGSCITADGRSVAFLSLATNLVPGDVNNQMDVFVHDSGEGRIVASCFGDGHSLACPCANDGLPGHGCDNSAGTGGAKLAASGHSSLSADSLLLSASDEMSTALSLFVESGELTSPAVFGSGLLCLGGEPARLYVEFAVGGVATAPQAGDASIAARSAALGEPIPWGATRHYQTYYRDPALSSCPAGTNAPWNVTNALSAIWSP